MAKKKTLENNLRTWKEINKHLDFCQLSVTTPARLGIFATHLAAKLVSSMMNFLAGPGNLPKNLMILVTITH